MNVKIVTFCPLESADKIRNALGEAGAGKVGEYSYCSFSVSGEGRFTPSANANPTLGELNTPESVNEERIEVVCKRSDAKKVIDVLKSVHPYEEVAFDIYELIDEEDL